MPKFYFTVASERFRFNPKDTGQNQGFRRSELDKLLLWAFGSHFLGAIGLGCHDIGNTQSRFKQTEFS